MIMRYIPMHMTADVCASVYVDTVNTNAIWKVSEDALISLSLFSVALLKELKHVSWCLILLNMGKSKEIQLSTPYTLLWF